MHAQSDSLPPDARACVARCLPALTVLRDYDACELAPRPQARPAWELTVEAVRAVVAELRAAFPQDAMLGLERGEDVARIVGAIYQGFAGQDMYPTVEGKAAHLLYFVVKDHPFADGNKRTAAALFAAFLAANAQAFPQGRAPEMGAGELAAVTLLVATSAPEEKGRVVDFVMRLLREDRPGA